MSDILNVALHPCDSSAVLGWMLWRWELDPHAHLMILTHKGDGPALDNRVRVVMAVARGTLKRDRVKHYKQFGFRTEHSKWTTLSGNEFDALYISRFTHKVHVLREALAHHMDKEYTNGRR